MSGNSAAYDEGQNKLQDYFHDYECCEIVLQFTQNHVVYEISHVKPDGYGDDYSVSLRVEEASIHKKRA